MFRTFLLSALAVTALTGLVACGDDDDDTDETATSTAATSTTETGDDGASPSPTEDGDATETATSTTTTSPGGGGDDARGEFTELIEGNEGASYTITYNATFEIEGESGEGTWTLVQDPPRSAAIIDFGDGKIWAINDGTDQYSCFEADGAGQCLKTGIDPTGEIIDVDETVDSVEDAAGDITEVDSRTVAGRDARCFQYTGEAVDDEGIMCLDAETGYLLYIESAGTVMEATEVSDSIDESVFEPPYDVLG